MNLCLVAAAAAPAAALVLHQNAQPVARAPAGRHIKGGQHARRCSRSHQLLAPVPALSRMHTHPPGWVELGRK